ncbi:TatD family hydrolase [Candidatus Woesearchaeota archaeon]|nr:TatD family hydrolase [Candidatus Woesearchaeota archaeon]
MLVDVHCHLDHELFSKDIDEVIERAKDMIAITAGVNHESNLNVLKLSKKYENIKASLGIYPLDALEMSDKEIDNEIQFIKKNSKNITAIGEIGLDFKEGKNRERQLKILTNIVNELEYLNKPFIVHSRGAEKESVELFEQLNVKKVVFHCFQGDFSVVKRIEDNGWMISIPCIVVRSKHFQNIINEVKLSQLLTETDSPFLSAESGKRNEPFFVIETIKIISRIKKIDEDEINKILFKNYQNYFC